MGMAERVVIDKPQVELPFNGVAANRLYMQ